MSYNVLLLRYTAASGHIAVRIAYRCATGNRDGPDTDLAKGIVGQDAAHNSLLCIYCQFRNGFFAQHKLFQSNLFLFHKIKFLR